MSFIRPIRRTGPASRPPHARPVRVVPARAALFREGDPADDVFELVSGTLRLVRVLETGRRQVVSFAHAGDVVGLPAGGRHHADCEALTDATVIAHRRPIAGGRAADPELCRRIHDAALNEVARLQDHLLQLARKGATGKLAAFIDALADRQGIPRPGGIAVELEMPRADIADYLCLTIETVSRTLTRMCEDGVILRDGPARLVISDRAGLRAMAGAD